MEKAKFEIVNARFEQIKHRLDSQTIKIIWNYQDIIKELLEENITLKKDHD